MPSIRVPLAMPARIRITCAAISTATTHSAGRTAWATLPNTLASPATLR